MQACQGCEAKKAYSAHCAECSKCKASLTATRLRRAPRCEEGQRLYDAAVAARCTCSTA